MSDFKRIHKFYAELIEVFNNKINKKNLKFYYLLSFIFRSN